MKLITPRKPHTCFKLHGGLIQEMVLMHNGRALYPVRLSWNPRNSTEGWQNQLFIATCILHFFNSPRISSRITRFLLNVLPLKWKMSSTYGYGCRLSLPANRCTIQAWKRSVAGITPIGSTRYCGKNAPSHVIEWN